jgi:hypothetical protein
MRSFCRTKHTLRVRSIPPPEGPITRRGRPQMTEEEKRKAREAREARKRALTFRL